MSLVMDDLVNVQDDGNYCTSLLILPSELLVMILSYLSIRDIISMQFVSQRFKEVSETSSLWKKFVWPDCEPYEPYEPYDVDSKYYENVIGMYFDKRYTPAHILEEVHYCSNLEHVILTRNIQLGLDHLEEIVHTLPHLEELDVFASSIKWDPSYHVHVIKLLEATASVKKLFLRLDWPFYENFYVPWKYYLRKVSHCHQSLIFSLIRMMCVQVLAYWNLGQHQVTQWHH